MRIDRERFCPLLRSFENEGYRFAQFDEELEGRVVLLRHDVDFCLDAALEAARIETGMGINATYFFMLSSNFYNLASQRSRTIVEQIRALGHTISLHYDPTAHDDSEEGFLVERDLFERLFSVKISMVSLHRPRDFLQNNHKKLPGVSHTYEDRYFREMKYISDSGGSFKFGHPLDSEAFANGRPIHLLLHPIWWVREGETPSEKIRTWQKDHYEFLNEEVSLNCLSFDRKTSLMVAAK